tara:strand:- start:567 stop:1022 length:456 start_codon:yes stop_codon:yes gene_type:complete
MSNMIKIPGQPDPTLLRGHFTPWSCNVHLSKYVAKIFKKLRKAWPESNCGLDSEIILSSIGAWGRNLNWSDEYGHYIQIRMDPTYSGMKRTRDNARKVVDAYKAIFPECVFKEENLDILDIECTDDWRNKDKRLDDTITIVVKLGSYSIGD